MKLKTFQSSSYAFHAGNSISCKAFSLIELLSVISIMALLMSLGIVATKSIAKGHAVRQAIDCAWSAACSARQQAISQRTPVALLLTNNRQGSDLKKSDAFITLAAQSRPDNDGAMSWEWIPLGAWQKLPQNIQVSDRKNSGEAHTFYEVTSLPASSSYSLMGKALPSLEGESISDYIFVVFRPDGTVDAPLICPFLEITRLQEGAISSDAALVLSRESGRVRMMRSH